MSDPAAPRQGLAAILPCSDLDAAQAFFERLGFVRRPGGPDKRPTDKPWGMYEFALNGPDDVLIRVGWPTRMG